MRHTVWVLIRARFPALKFSCFWCAMHVAVQFFCRCLVPAVCKLHLSLTMPTQSSVIIYRARLSPLQPPAQKTTPQITLRLPAPRPAAATKQESQAGRSRSRPPAREINWTECASVVASLTDIEDAAHAFLCTGGLSRVFGSGPSLSTSGYLEVCKTIAVGFSVRMSFVSFVST